jgi:hypothetical protein
VAWQELFERERARYEDGVARLDPEQLVRLGNAAYGAGLALLMLNRRPEASAWLERARARWRESWAVATPTSWGRPIGTIKAALLAGRDDEAADAARWTLSLDSERASSPIGRYAAALALLTLERWEDGERTASTLRAHDDFPADVAEALVLIGAGDALGFCEALEAVLASFETREGYLEDVPVADTVLVLQLLARTRGIAVKLRVSPMLPSPAFV